MGRIGFAGPAIPTSANVDPGYFSVVTPYDLSDSPATDAPPNISIPNFLGPLLGGGTPSTPATPSLPIATTPGPVAFRPGNWDLSRDPSEYVIAQGDTMVGIAALYLGRGDRWGEIRDLQINPDGQLGPNGPYLNHYDSKWYPGSTAPGSSFREGAVLIMPAEAAAKAKQLGANPATPTAPTTPGAPGTKPPGIAPTPPGAGMSKGGKAALAFGGAAILGLIAVKVFA